MPSKGDATMASAAEPVDGSGIPFRIRFRGELNPAWFATLQDVRLESTGRGKSLETTINGDALDEGVIMGILNMLYELGCSIITVETFNTDGNETFR